MTAGSDGTLVWWDKDERARLRGYEQFKNQAPITDCVISPMVRCTTTAVSANHISLCYVGKSDDLFAVLRLVHGQRGILRPDGRPHHDPRKLPRRPVAQAASSSSLIRVLLGNKNEQGKNPSSASRYRYLLEIVTTSRECHHDVRNSVIINEENI